MKEIIWNDDHLTEEELQMHKFKVRALIINHQEQVMITNYCDQYLLPGGKRKPGETNLQALLRELEEELGIDYQEELIEPFLTVTTMARNYPTRKLGETVNRSCTTTYYIIHSDQIQNRKKAHLSESEQKNHFQVEVIPLEHLVEIITNDVSHNPRDSYQKKELLTVIKEFFQKEYQQTIPDSKEWIDLHLHTTASDGEDSPQELVEKAIQNHLTTIAITDHDTVEGLLQLNNDQNQIQVIPGIELSAQSETGRMHILGYGIDPSNSLLQSALKEIKEESQKRIGQFLEVLKRDQITFPEAAIENLFQSSHILGRPDLAKLMVQQGIVATPKEAFDRYLEKAHTQIQSQFHKPSYQTCIDLIKKANGLSVLAHPNSLLLNEQDLWELIQKMKSSGLQGLEVYHSSFTKEQSKLYIKMALEANLMMTGGSDYHGPFLKPDIELGTGRNQNIKIKQLSFLKKMN